ncbi:MAG: peptidoglycan-binding domain-containing protein [Caulobacteraceae bacterium]
MSIRPAFAAALIASTLVASAALADPQLAGAPQQGWGQQAWSSQTSEQAWSEETSSETSSGDRYWGAHGWTPRTHPRAHAEHAALDAPRGHAGGECYAKVKFGAQYAAPPTGPEYVWTQQPGPPGSPGPIWCLTVQALPQQPVMISPERYGWVRVLCDTDATPTRISSVQRRLSERGMYRGAIDGRYDEQTAYAVRRFQSERHIEDRGYLSYQTLSALEVAPPAPQRVYWRRPTTFETGVLDWPGKTRF